MNSTLKNVIFVVIIVSLSACQTVGYYAQAVGGHARILLKQKLISSVLLDEAVSLETKVKLKQVQKARDFAFKTLLLPQSKSYSRYADIGRDYVVWNVVATPQFNVEPIQSCFWVVGCISYQGFYDKGDALQQAAKRKAQGYDVYVGGVGAYSTLGWLADPVLNTMLGRSDTALAALIFHELAHQKIYIKSDTQFNESFATAVASMGLREWAQEQGKEQGQESEPDLDQYFKAQIKIKEIVSLVLAARKRMQEAYSKAYSRARKQNTQVGDAALRKIKAAQFEMLKKEYQALKQQGGGTAGYNRFFASELNHASLALFGEYHGQVAAFERLFDQNGKDWKAFYQAVEQLSKQARPTRDIALKRL